MYSILIVEDEPSLLSIMSDKLNTQDYSVLTAKNGTEGLEQALKEHPDLILLDILMPRMDGMEMLRALRKDEWGKKARVLILTNLNDIEKREEAYQLGALDFLVKTDWTMQDVFSKIKKALEQGGPDNQS